MAFNIYRKLQHVLLVFFFIHIVTPLMSAGKNHLQTNVLVKDTVFIEIWTDVVCPFCYLGKKNLEKALESLDDTHTAQITWRSFQLNPDLETDTTASITDYLSKTKGINESDVRRMYLQINNMASKAGLQYNLENTVLANSLNAHCLIKFATQKGKQNPVMEDLFHAHFTLNQNIDDNAVLFNIASKNGLDTREFTTAMSSGRLYVEVEADQAEANRLGISSVPFFVFNRQFAISGAQEPAVFQRFIAEKIK